MANTQKQLPEAVLLDLLRERTRQAADLPVHLRRYLKPLEKSGTIVYGADGWSPSPANATR